MITSAAAFTISVSPNRFCTRGTAKRRMLLRYSPWMMTGICRGSLTNFGTITQDVPMITNMLATEMARNFMLSGKLSPMVYILQNISKG